MCELKVYTQSCLTQLEIIWNTENKLTFTYMAWKSISDRFRTVKWIKYRNWAIVEWKNTKEARENYRINKSYVNEKFILMKSPEFFESYDVLIPID